MRFKVIVTREVTESATIEVEASEEDWAAQAAREAAKGPGIVWRRDDPIPHDWQEGLFVSGIEEVEAYPVPGKFVNGGRFHGLPFGMVSRDGPICRCGDCTLGMNRGTVVVIAPAGPIFWGHAGEAAEASLARYQNTGGAF